jgi:hypothetical protein
MKKTMYRVIAAIVGMLTLTALSVSAQVASGGSYTLNQAVVASGGGTSNDAGNNYKVEGTAGQTVAGTFANAGSYSIRSGFWSPNPFAPTAAGVNVSGRVITANGAGIRNVIVVLTGGNLFTPRTTRTGTFGNFTFEDVTVGQIYIVTVEGKKYNFPQSSQIISLVDNVTDIVFQADWEN